MPLLVGGLLGLGLLLVASPWLWPTRDIATTRSTPHLVRRLRDRMTQAGLHAVSIPTLFVVAVILGAASAATVFAIVPVTALAAVAGIVAFILPLVLIAARARASRRAARTIWPDLVDHLVSAVRSGLALPDSVITLARTGSPIARDAFGSFERDYRATGDFGLCLDELKERLADPVADRVLETLRMSREVGGSELTTVLRNLASYLRQEAAIRSEVEARQSWVVNAARLGVAAPWVILVLLSSRPEAASAYNSSTGIALIVGGLAVSVVAYRVMLAIGRIPEERRWFQ